MNSDVTKNSGKKYTGFCIRTAFNKRSKWAAMKTKLTSEINNGKENPALRVVLVVAIGGALVFQGAPAIGGNNHDDVLFPVQDFYKAY